MGTFSTNVIFAEMSRRRMKDMEYKTEPSYPGLILARSRCANHLATSSDMMSHFNKTQSCIVGGVLSSVTCMVHSRVIIIVNIEDGQLKLGRLIDD